MPILSTVGRKSWSNRLFTWFLYGTLSFFGMTMAIPFLITITGSATNAFDYERFSILPRTLWSKEDRFVKGLVHFFNGHPGWFVNLQNAFPKAPPTWTSWRGIGLDTQSVDQIARHYLAAPAEERALWATQAADYAEFALSYPVEDSVATFTNEQAGSFMALRYGRLWAAQNPETAGKFSPKAQAQAGLELLSKAWGVPIPSYFSVNFQSENRAPMGQQTWSPSDTPKYRDYLLMLDALRHGFATPGVLGKWERFLARKGVDSQSIRLLSPLPANATPDQRELWLEFARTQAPASPTLPFSMRLLWIQFLSSDEARPLVGLGEAGTFDIRLYNNLAGTNYESLRDTPFPLPPTGFQGLRPAWERFLESRYPLRLVSITPDEELTAKFHSFLESRYQTLDNINRLLRASANSWSDFVLPANLPDGTTPGAAGLRETWMDFVKTLPASRRSFSSSEAAYQSYLISKYGSLEEINAAYGWRLGLIEEASPPFDKAYAITYEGNALAFAWDAPATNYLTVVDYLTQQGRAIPVTLWLIALSIFCSLTINPMAGYALSRFNLRNKDKIILFCLATAAFPAMVSAIPGYLLMRDLGLLNTFFALVLPGAASGMGIFILKGFFDSLPQELYEAATIDGAREYQIFINVSLPMVTPILAVNALNAFLGAYGSWEWALIICQDKDMWTLSVWLYQASQWWSQTPWISTAGFVLASIPTLLVFFFCQNIILRGIIVPSMK
jgi:ABC-type glycerol-3-phosphate transport system permease component